MTRIKFTVQLMWRYATGILGLRQDDVWLASFPRAGSTWVRFLLCNLISLSELEGQEMDFHFLDATMPRLGRDNLLEPWRFRTVPRFVKTHQPYRRLLFAVPTRCVYILRDPRDVMVSCYHYFKGHLWRSFQGSFGEFIHHRRYGLGAYLKHSLSWTPHTTVVIRYEELKRDTAAELRRMLTTLQIPVCDELVECAVERSSFENIRAVERRSGLSGPKRFNQQFEFARKGESKQWPDYFSGEDLAFYERVRKEYGFDWYD